MRSSLPSDKSSVSEVRPMPHPIVAAFPSHAAAEKAADDLRNMGVPNEDIAVLRADATVISAANAPETYRATDMADSKQLQQDAAPEIVGGDPEERSRQTPKNPDQDLTLAFGRPNHVQPDPTALVSVAPNADNADAIKQTLQAAGGVLQRRATDRRLTDQGAEDPESNTRVA